MANGNKCSQCGSESTLNIYAILPVKCNVKQNMLTKHRRRHHHCCRCHTTTTTDKQKDMCYFVEFGTDEVLHVCSDALFLPFTISNLVIVC